MTPHAGDVGQPEWLPDFVDPDDVVPASLDASATWGEETPRASSTVTPERRGVNDSSRGSDAAAPGRTRSSTGFGDGSPDSRQPSRSGKGRGKKRLTWEEKRARREKRAAERKAAQDAERAKDPLGFAREIVLTQLTAAPKSRAQLESKLRDKEVDEDVIDAVLDRMEDVGLVDDAAYAQMLVRSQVAGRGLGRRALQQELARKGIGADDAAEALEQVDDESEREVALALVRKKMRTMARLDRETQTRRLAGLLARKGYSSGMCWSVIREVHSEFDDNADREGNNSFDDIEEPL